MAISFVRMHKWSKARQPWIPTQIAVRSDLRRPAARCRYILARGWCGSSLEGPWCNRTAPRPDCTVVCRRQNHGRRAATGCRGAAHRSVSQARRNASCGNDHASDRHANAGAYTYGLDGPRLPCRNLGLQAASPGLPSLRILKGRVLCEGSGNTLGAEGVVEEHLHAKANRVAVDSTSCAHRRFMGDFMTPLAASSHVVKDALMGSRIWAHNPCDCNEAVWGDAGVPGGRSLI